MNVNHKNKSAGQRDKKRRGAQTMVTLVPPDRMRLARRKVTKFGEKVTQRHPRKSWTNARTMTTWVPLGVVRPNLLEMTGEIMVPTPTTMYVIPMDRAPSSPRTNSVWAKRTFMISIIPIGFRKKKKKQNKTRRVCVCERESEREKMVAYNPDGELEKEAEEDVRRVH